MGMEILRGIFVSSSLRNEHVIGCIINCHLIARTIVSVIIYDGIMPFRFQLNAQMPCSSNLLHISQSNSVSLFFYDEIKLHFPFHSVI